PPAAASAPTGRQAHAGQRAPEPDCTAQNAAPARPGDAPGAEPYRRRQAPADLTQHEPHTAARSSPAIAANPRHAETDAPRQRHPAASAQPCRTTGTPLPAANRHPPRSAGADFRHTAPASQPASCAAPRRPDAGHRQVAPPHKGGIAPRPRQAAPRRQTAKPSATSALWWSAAVRSRLSPPPPAAPGARPAAARPRQRATGCRPPPRRARPADRPWSQYRPAPEETGLAHSFTGLLVGQGHQAL